MEDFDAVLADADLDVYGVFVLGWDQIKKIKKKLEKQFFLKKKTCGNQDSNLGYHGHNVRY